MFLECPIFVILDVNGHSCDTYPKFKRRMMLLQTYFFVLYVNKCIKKFIHL